MSKREIKRRIYLSGVFGVYVIHHDMPGEAFTLAVPSTRIGNAIVRTLRALAFTKERTNA